MEVMLMVLLTSSFLHRSISENLKSPNVRASFYKRNGTEYTALLEKMNSNKIQRRPLKSTLLLLECIARYPIKWTGDYSQYNAYAESRRHAEYFGEPNNYTYIARLALERRITGPGQTPMEREEEKPNTIEFTCESTFEEELALKTVAYVTVYEESPPSFTLELTSEYETKKINSTQRISGRRPATGATAATVTLTMHIWNECWLCEFFDEMDKDLLHFLRRCSDKDRISTPSCELVQGKYNRVNVSIIEANKTYEECSEITSGSRFVQQMQFCFPEEGDSEVPGKLNDFAQGNLSPTPQLYVEWSRADPAKMLYIHPFEREVIYVGEELTVQCEYSRFHFSLGSWFAVEHPDGRLEYIKAFERKKCHLSEFFAWANEQEFNMGGLVGCQYDSYDGSVVSSVLRRKFQVSGYYKIFCVGPVWDTTDWLNVSLPLSVYEATSMDPPAIEIKSLADSEAGIQNKNEPVGNAGGVYFLNCRAKYPIEWTFHYKEGKGVSRTKRIVAQAETRRDAVHFEEPASYSYSASITLEYGGETPDLSHFTCRSAIINDPKLQTHVQLTEMGNSSALQLTVDAKIETPRTPEPYSIHQDNCAVNLLYYAQNFGYLYDEQLCLDCDTSDTFLRTLTCHTPIECNSLRGRAAKITNCLRREWFTCSRWHKKARKLGCNYEGKEDEKFGGTNFQFGCGQFLDSNVFKSVPVFAQCLSKENLVLASGLLYFGLPFAVDDYPYHEYSYLRKLIEEQRLVYSNWEDVNPSKMLYMLPVKPFILPDESVEFECEYSRFYFSLGTWFALKHESGDIEYFQAVDTRPCDTERERQQANSESGLNRGSCNSSEKVSERGTFIGKFNTRIQIPGNYQIFCYGPVWNTTDWINTTRSFIVVKWEEPRVVSVTPVGNEKFTIGEKNRALTCKFSGRPAPHVWWATPRLAQSKSDTKNTTSTLILDEVSHLTGGRYRCHADSYNSSDFQEFILKPEKPSAERLSRTLIAAIAVGCLVVLAILIALIALIGKMGITIVEQRKELRLLTDTEVKEFKEGIPELASAGRDRSEYIDNVGAIDALPYDDKYEIPLDRLVINYAALLGSGEYGLILRAKLLPQKTSNYANLAMQFSAETNAMEMLPIEEGSDFPSHEIEVAVKLCKKNLGVEPFKSLLSEVKVMAFMGRHDNIVSLIGASTENIRNREIYIAEELCQNGSLDNFVRKNKKQFFNKVKSGRYCGELQPITPAAVSSSPTDDISALPASDAGMTFSTTELIRWAREVAAGIEHIHGKRVIHGDLALRNVLLTKNLVAKIGDFGLSRRLGGERSIYAKTTECPLPWRSMAIESLQELHFSAKSDMWSLGVTLWELFTLGRLPYQGISYTTDFVKQIEDGSLRLPKPHYAPNNIFEFMMMCWESVPEDRPSTVEIKVICNDHLSN